MVVKFGTWEWTFFRCYVSPLLCTARITTGKNINKSSPK